MCFIPPVLLLRLIIRQVRLSPPFLLLLKISSSRTCPRTVRLVIFKTDLHGVVTLRESCDGGDCCRNVGHETGSAQAEQSSSHQNQRKKLHRHELKGPERYEHGCTRKINMRTPCANNLCRNNKCTTGAEDTQNQHYQRVLTVVDTWLRGPATTSVTSEHAKSIRCLNPPFCQVALRTHGRAPSSGYRVMSLSTLDTPMHVCMVDIRRTMRLPRLIVVFRRAVWAFQVSCPVSIQRRARLSLHESAVALH